MGVVHGDGYGCVVHVCGCGSCMWVWLFMYVCGSCVGVVHVCECGSCMLRCDHVHGVWLCMCGVGGHVCVVCLCTWGCGSCTCRYLVPPNTWVLCPLESQELMRICLKRLRGLNKVHLIDAGFVWTEPHSKRIKVKITLQKEVGL